MFDFLGKIPDNIIIATSGSRNSMAVVDFISRTNRRVKMLHVDFGLKDSKDRISFIKSTAKAFNVNFEVVKGDNKKSHNEFSRFSEMMNIFQKNAPNFVVTCQSLDDVVLHYLINCIRCNPKLIQYRHKNIIRPYISTKQEEIDYWITSKKVAFFDDGFNDMSNTGFIKKYMLENAYKINPTLQEDILKIVEKDFQYFVENRNTNGTRS